MKEKTKRAPNFSSSEEELLVSLVDKRKEVLECKKTDINASKLKEQAWQNLTAEFNANNSQPRDAQTLRRKYENIKKRTKKRYADEKVYLKGTGGGPTKHIKFNSVDESVKSILGTRVTGKASEFDDDHEINTDDRENRIPVILSPLVVHIPEAEEHNVLEIVDDVSLCIESGTKEAEVSQTGFTLQGCSETRNESVKQASKDWSKYDPAMLQQPRSCKFVPSVAKKKGLVLGPLSTQTTLRSASKHTSNTVWTQVGNAKLELLQLQKQIILEDNQQKRERENEIHAKTLQYMKEEHDIKIKILEMELAYVKKKK
ncbi:hypothetical protein NQ315_012801 [Exocentrus adspersus]|uniref:Regulatory protein zeste n=1 Tax=Exocentrus adspersus TaxID=1586481 RepID=A0AAV8VBH7_9CUCU|nr:hypothetical protein NQ315_012801 [Exocentrus adspersus]